MATLEIRAYQPDDESAIVDLWKTCGLVVPWNDPVADIERTRRLFPDWFLVGETEGDLVASCMAGFDGHRGSIYYLAVHPDHQGKGWGRAILAESEERLKQAGCPKINLMVRSTNCEVIGFYQRLGYADNQCLSLGKRLSEDAPEPSDDAGRPE